MAKLFQNIGRLEDRPLPQINMILPEINQGKTIAQLPLSTQPKKGIIVNYKPTRVDQGIGHIKTQIPKPKSIISQLHTLSSLHDKDASQLKLLVNNLPGIGNIPVRYSFFQKLNSNIHPQSTIIITFPNKISLEDRLKQSNLGTTQHLPQFFLSDLYTGYIKIKPFKFSSIQGGTNPRIFNTKPIGGGTTPTLAIGDIRGLQGIVTVNNVSTSIINIGPYNPLIKQGTVTSNNIVNSVTIISNFNPLISQGEADIVVYNFNPNQGGITVINSQTIPLQVGITVGAFNFTPLQGETANIVDFPLKSALQEEGLNPKAFIFTPTQGGIDPTTLNFTPKQGERYPNIFSYEVDKIAAIFTPLLKHGASLLNTAVWQSFKAKQGLLSEDEYDIQHASIDTNRKLYKDQKNNLGINSDGTYKQLAPVNPISTLNLEESDNIEPNLNQLVDFPANNQPSSLANYATLGYSSIARKATKPKNSPVSDFRQDINQRFPAPFNKGQNYDNSNMAKRIGIGDYGKGGVDRSDFLQDLGLSDSLYQSVDKVGNDLVKLRFTSVRENQTIQFRSYIKAFSEDYSIDYNDVEYIGRPDKLKLFKGNGRSGTLNFIVPAGTKQETRVMHQKLNKLAQNIYGAKYDATGRYFVSPFILLTVGDYYNKMPVNITSLKYDTNPSDYPWEINITPNGKVGDLFEGPQYVDVSISYNVIGHHLPISTYDIIDTPSLNPATGQNTPI